MCGERSMITNFALPMMFPASGDPASRKGLRDTSGGRIYHFPSLVMHGNRHGFIQIAGGHFVDGDVMEGLQRFSSQLCHFGTKWQ